MGTAVDLDRILIGIDKCETDVDEGWWETSVGAEFGAGKLAEVKAAFAKLEAENVALKQRLKKKPPLGD